MNRDQKLAIVSLLLTIVVLLFALTIVSSPVTSEEIKLVEKVEEVQESKEDKDLEDFLKDLETIFAIQDATGK